MNNSVYPFHDINIIERPKIRTWEYTQVLPVSLLYKPEYHNISI
jgi:hypothetical protein